MRSSILKNSCIAALFILAAISAAPVNAEGAAKAHVAVVRIANDTGSSSYDAACKAATDTLALTLRELGKYEVRSDESLGSGGEEEALRAKAADEKLDFIMYGSMTSAGGGIACSLSVYDRAKGKTSLSKTKKAAGVLDIFDVADELVVTVLESMTGSHIGFGSIELRNRGEKGSYRVLVDGSPAGNDLESLGRVLIGKRQVTIAQQRMLGDREIAKASVEVKEGASVAVEFSVPYLMNDEKAKVEGLSSEIKAGVAGSDSSAMDAKLGELAKLLVDVSYSPRLSAYKDEAKQLGGEWTIRKSRLAIEGAAWEPNARLLDAAGKVNEDAGSYPDPKSIQGAFEENARLLAILLELNAGQELSVGDIDGASKAFGEALTLSTRYLGGERLSEYAYAISTLKELKERGGAQGAESVGGEVAAVFGPWIEAGKRFAGLRDQVGSGKADAIIASDFQKPVSVEGGEYAKAPLRVAAAQGIRSLNVQPKGEAKSVALAGTGKILFVSDGFAAFGKLAVAPSAGSATPKLQSAPEPSFGAVTVGMGSLAISVATAGILQMGGHAVQVPAGGTLPVNNVAPGDYSLTMTYGDGKSETKTATVKAGEIVEVAFIHGQTLREYKIGDVGPAGGLVFYDKGKIVKGWRYLEAAPEDVADSSIWGANFGAWLSAPWASIESSREYIDNLIPALGGAERCTAVLLCKSLTMGGFSDWFLPTKGQLDLMYKNLRKAGLGKFASDWYWSSSINQESNNENGSAYCQSFSRGSSVLMSLGFKARVRAVRAF